MDTENFKNPVEISIENNQFILIADDKTDTFNLSKNFGCWFNGSSKGFIITNKSKNKTLSAETPNPIDAVYARGETVMICEKEKACPWVVNQNLQIISMPEKSTGENINITDTEKQ